MATKKNTSWPVFITVFYIVFVMLMFSVLLFSQKNRTNLVTENYYEEEIRYEEQISRIRNTNALNAKPAIEYDKTKKILVIRMPDELKNISYGKIKMFRPSNANLDVDYDLNLINDRQVISTDNLSSGLWMIKFSWVQDKKEYYLEKTIIL